MSASSYKSSKEAFVSGMTGSSVTHVNTISLVALISIALYSTLRSRIYLSRTIPFSLAWLVLVLPLLLSMTTFANNAGTLSILILVPTSIILLLRPRQSGISLPSASNQPVPPPTPGSSGFSSPAIPSPYQIIPLPALTTYRAHMLLMTILAILAVDFPVFPRSLAKCETFGVSLMDMGVGSFVFSQGIVSAIPLLKDPSYLSSPLGIKLYTVVRKALPIIFLGLARVLLVKGTQYPEHESEYGTHWNFFITLALLPILQVLLHPLILRIPVGLIGITIAALQQICLSLFGLKDFVLTAPRTNLLSANKEGVVSLIGYLAIHILGLSTGLLVLPPSPSYFRRSLKNGSQANAPQASLQAGRQTGKTIIELFSFSIVWWFLMGATRLFDVDGGVSRRLVNLSYIFWVTAYNTSFVLGNLLLDSVFFPSSVPSKSKSQTLRMIDTSNVKPPELLDAINKNGLALFLLANVATGLINMILPTMYMSDLWAMMVLSAYSLGVSAVAWIFRHDRVWRL